jgi:hypothetical protein
MKGLKMSVNLEKESSWWSGLFKPTYRISLFGLYNIERRGDIDAIKNEINGFIDPTSLRRRGYEGWEWSLNSCKKRLINFKGQSDLAGEEQISLTLRSSSKEGLFASLEDIKEIFNLLRVRFPQSLKTQLKTAKANVTPIRQSTQFSCVSTSTCMALNSLGVECTEEEVNKVIGAKPMRGARWEEVLACAQYFGCRATLTTPSTLTQVKEWTDAGKPVLIAWNPEGRDWSHASLIFDVTGERGNYLVHIADPNIPNPDKTVREVSEDEFYGKWYEKWPDYLVRRPALMIEKEITPEGKQVMASIRIASKKSTMVERIASRHLRDNHGNVFESIRGMEGPIRFKNGMVLYYDPRENGGTYYNSRTDMYLSEKEMDYILAGKYGWEKEAGARDKPRTLQGGTIKVPIRGGHVLISKWALDHIMSHNEIGTGSVFSRAINERTLISLVQKAPIKGNGGLYTMKASNVGYNLVLPMDEALRLPDATKTMVQKEERGKKIDVQAVETSAPLRSFQTDIVTLIIRPSNPQFLPQDAKQIPAILEDVRDGRSYSVLTAFPGNPDIPPSSQWGGKYAVIIPS